MAPYRAGIALDCISSYEKFEAPDPAEWAERGYAVLNTYARGAVIAKESLRAGAFKKQRIFTMSSIGCLNSLGAMAPSLWQEIHGWPFRKSTLL